jgi:hypothetical protein
MERHTIKAAVMTLILYSVAVPLILLATAALGHGNLSGRLLGLLIYGISAYIFWSWLVVDVKRNGLPRSVVFRALAAYAVLFVLAVGGYLFYSRGPARGFGAVMWFALLVGAAVVGFLAMGKIISASWWIIPVKS